MRYIAILIGFLTCAVFAQDYAPTFRSVAVAPPGVPGASGLAANFVNQCAVDGNGNVYVAGSFTSSQFQLGNITLTNSGSFDGFILKLDGTLNGAWAKNSGSTNENFVHGLVLDKAGNAYVAVTFSASTGHFDGVDFTSSSNTFSVILKYSTTGQMLWHRQIDGVTDDGWANTLALDGNTNTFFAAFCDDQSLVLTKLDPAGVPAWSTREGIVSTPGNRALSVAVDADGNSFVAGAFTESAVLFGTITVTNSGSGLDMFLVKYDSSGDVIWAQSAGGTAGDDEPMDIAVDGSGDCYVIGDSYSSAPVFGTNVLTTNGNRCFIAKYDGGGAVSWVKRISETPELSLPLRISIANGTNIFVAVASSSGEISSESPSFLAKLSRDGEVLWRKRVKTDTEQPELSGRRPFWPESRVVGDNEGNLYVAGTTALQEGFCAFDSFVFYPTNAAQFVARMSFNPLLKIDRTGTQVTLRWSTNEPGFVLEANAALLTNGWSTVTNPVVVTGNENTVTTGIGAAAAFYRLRK